MSRTIAEMSCPEYFEIYNPTEEVIDLADWTVESTPVGGTGVVVPLAAMDDYPAVQPHSYRVYAAWSDTFFCASTTQVNAVYRDAISLSLWGGSLILRDGAGVVRDVVEWDSTWPARPGVAMELVDARLDNSVRENWAAARTVSDVDEGGDLYGTPGRDPAPPLDPPQQTPCDDGNPCTLDVCETVAGCLHLVSDEPCDDGDPCTTDDVCEARDGRVLCVGRGALDCDDGDPCTADVCDPSCPGGCRNERLSGACVPDMACPPDCPESDDPCFDFVCGEDGRCALVATQSSCDDGDPCTVEDTCQDGLCRGRPPVLALGCPAPDLERKRIGEPLCLPEYDAVGYPILEWSDGCCQGHWGRYCYEDIDCPQLEGDCAEVVCWPVTLQCMILRR